MTADERFTAAADWVGEILDHHGRETEPEEEIQFINHVVDGWATGKPVILVFKKLENEKP